MHSHMLANNCQLPPQFSRSRHALRTPMHLDFFQGKPDWDRRTAITARPTLNDAFDIRTTDPVMPSSILAFRARLQPPIVRNTSQDYVPYQTDEVRSPAAPRSSGHSRGGLSKTRTPLGMTRTLSRESASPATGLAAALLADTGAGEGSWIHPNPRALWGLPHALLVSGRIDQMIHLLTNPHFLVQKMGERGVAEVVRDLERAERHVKSRLALAPQDVVYSLCERVSEWRAFMASNAASLRLRPASLFSLGRATEHKAVAVVAGQSGRRADAVLGALHGLLDPYQIAIGDGTRDDQLSVCRMLIARRELAALQDHGVYGEFSRGGVEYGILEMTQGDEEQSSH